MPFTVLQCVNKDIIIKGRTSIERKSGLVCAK